MKQLMAGWKKVLGILLLTGLLAGFAVNASAASAQFNFLSGDLPFLSGRNISQNQTNPVNPVSANPGDIVEGVIYYHNGIENVTANNVHVSLSLPQGVASSFTINGQLTADNAPTITETVVNGQVVGLGGLEINSSAPASLSIVSGSVSWYPDGSQTPVALLNNQTGNELFTSTGLNLGDIQGCWAHAGYILFRVQLNAPAGQAQLTLNKEAMVGTTTTPFNGTWANQVQASVGDVVSYRLELTNPGNADITNVNLKDVLPNGLVYQSGSAHLYADNNNTPLNTDLSQLFGSGSNLGPLASQSGSKINSPKLLLLAYQAKVSGNFSCGLNVLTNTAVATGSGLTASASAKTALNYQGAGCQTSANIVQSKSAYNNTQKIDATKVAAAAGDSITYTLTTSNTGNAAADNYVIQDGIQDILDYASPTSISDNGKLVNQPNASNRDDQVLVQYPAITINPGQTVTRTFVVSVKNPIPDNPQNGYAFDYVMYNFYGNAVTIVVQRPAVANVVITKKVIDLTNGSTAYTGSDVAVPGDVLGYQVEVTNSGNLTVQNALLTDLLPNGVSYIDGSLALTMNGQAIAMPSGQLFSNGLTLPDLGQGSNLVVTFKGQTDGHLANGTNLVNTATIAYLNQKQSATASTAIVVVVPAPTPTPTPTPILPNTGNSNPFTWLFSLTGLVYAGTTRLKTKRNFKHLSRYVEIV